MNMKSAFVSSFLPRSTPSTLASTFVAPLRKHHVSSVAAPSRSIGTTMILDLSKSLNLFQTEVVDIPQNDEANKAEREKSVQDGQKEYVWRQDGIGNASMAKGLPKGEVPSVAWMGSLVPVVLTVAINTALNAGETDVTKLTATLNSTLNSIVTSVMEKTAIGGFGLSEIKEVTDKIGELVKPKTTGRGQNFEDFKDLYKVIKRDLILKNDQFLRDDIFGWYRVAGLNPMSFAKLTKPVNEIFPELSDEILQGIPSFGGDTLDSLFSEGRLYILDYAAYEPVKTGKDVDGNQKPNFIYAPTCLMAVPKNPSERETLLPLAIRCAQDRDSYPMYTANNEHTDIVTWTAAKMCVHVTDLIEHEIVYHLARTHLLCGIYICATHRSLPKQHPLFRLIQCHSYGTTLINAAAVVSLINPGGPIDTATAPDISVSQNLAASRINGDDSKFNDWFPDTDLNKRGLMDSTLRFPYRDDALAHWDAVTTWVRSFLSAYYKSDEDVQGDQELAAWCRELTDSDKGNLHGFGDSSNGTITTLNYLTRVVSMFIFSASVQHAAVNFTQGPLGQYVPSIAMSGYDEAPKTKIPYESYDQYVQKMMPTLPNAELQLNVMQALGEMRFGTYADYGSDLNFAPDEVQVALNDFQAQLANIGANILERNKVELAKDLPPYSYLVPKNIPQSINI